MMDYMTTSREAMDIYEERLRQSAEIRRASEIIASRRQNRPSLLVRFGEMLISLGEGLKQRGGWLTSTELANLAETKY